MPKVSVVVPVFNGAEFIAETLNSILAQTYTDFEIIVIDDGSTDDTPKIAQEYVAKNAERIRYVAQENGGVSVARNTGVEQSKGEFVAFLDSDDTWEPEKLAYSIKEIEGDSTIGLVHCNIKRVKLDGSFLEIPKRDKRFLSGSIFKYLFLRKAHIACSTVLFRHECFDKVGPFDVELTRLGCEDREWWLRIAEKYKIQYIDQVLVNYRVHDTGFSRNKDKMLEARKYVIDKYYPSKLSLLRRRAYGKIYRDLGDEFLYENDLKQARSNYLKSLGFIPITFWSWVNLLKTLGK